MPLGRRHQRTKIHTRRRPRPIRTHAEQKSLTLSAPACKIDNTGGQLLALRTRMGLVGTLLTSLSGPA
jgi:hypothetical protein